MAKKKESRKDIVFRTRRGARERRPRKVREVVEGAKVEVGEVVEDRVEEVMEEVAEVKEESTKPPSYPDRPVSDITCVIVNHKTPVLIEQALTSLTAHYPELVLILIDNNSQDESTDYLCQFMENSDTTVLIINHSNIGHGPALHQGITLCRTPYTFFMDSDCIVNHRGFLELMLDAFDTDPHLYAIGQLLYTNVNGVIYRNQSSQHVHKIGIPGIHPHAMMLRRDLYPTFPPFYHSGAPAMSMMQAAYQNRIHIQDFPIHLYVTHLGRGTRRMYSGSWRGGD